MEIEELVKRAKEGDETAFSELYEKTVKRAYFYTLKSIKNEAEAKDILQNAYISCFNNIDQLKDDAKFENWLTVSISRKIKNYFNRSKVDKSTTVFSHLDKEEDGLLFVESIEDKTAEFQPKSQVDYDELKQAMAEIIDELKPDQRMAVLLYYFEGLSIKEVADSLDMSVSAIKSKLNYSRNKMKEKVDILQKSGKPIFGIMPIPFMIWLLKEEAKAMELPSSLTTFTSTASTASTVTSQVIKSTLSKKIIGTVISAVVVIGGATTVLNQSTPVVKERISYIDKELTI